MFKAACIQLRSTRSVGENIETASQLIRQAAADGASYIQTPEMTHLVETGRASLMEKIVEEPDDQGVKAFGALAKELSITLHIGSLAILRNDGKVANRAFVFGPDGSLITTYDKIHMFDVDLDNGESWRESNTYEPGVRSPVVETGDAKIGVAICYDVRFPEVFRRQALAGADILTAPACFTRQTGQAHWHVLMRSRAIENGSFMISAAQGGIHEDGRKTFGHSIIVDPWGNVIADSENDEPGFITAKIDLQDVLKARKRIPVLTHGREFDTSAVSYRSEKLPQ
ncbi:MAG: carbon-nitrogen hydrolase family protein [Hyphomicrobiales bacterium]